MKKALLYSLVAMASFSLAGCDGDYDDWAKPQALEEGNAATYGVTATNGEDANVVMPLRNEDLKLVTLTADNEAVESFAVRKVLINGEEIDATVNNGNIIVNTNELDDMIQKQTNSRASVKRDITVKSVVSVITNDGDAIAIVDTLTTTASLTPAPTPAIDENGYFLLGNFEDHGWSNPTNPLMMTKVSDGVYTATVNTVNEGDNWFKFYCGSYNDGTLATADKGEMGCKINGDKSLKGFVIFTDDKYGVNTPVISGKGQFDITLDMNNFTYKIARSESKYYMIGKLQNGDGRNPNETSVMFYNEGDGIYSYTSKFQTQWDLKILEYKHLGDWKSCYGPSVDGSTDASGSLVTDGKAQAFGANAKGGWYTLTINMTNFTYTWTAIPEPTTTYSHISLIGSFNSWGADVDMTQLANAPHNWYVKYTLDSESELKFRADHDWTTSWGTTKADKDKTIGDIYSLSPGTENIKVAAGTYEFYFNDITGRFSIAKVKAE